MGAAAKRTWLVIGTVVLTLSLLVGIGWIVLNPHRGQAVVDDSTLALDQVLTREEALGDLDFVADVIRDRHVWAADGLPGAVAAAWEAERAALPDQPTVLDVWRASSRILVALGDGHTFVGVPHGDETPYGIDYAMVNGDLHVDAGDIRLPVASINGVPAADVVERNRRLTPADNPGWVEGRLVERLRYDDGLEFLGIPTAGSDYRVELVAADPAAAFLVAAPAAPSDRSTPVAEYTVEDDLAVFTLHRCEPDDSYRAALEEFFGDVAERGVDSIVVDLRGNPGGDSRVVNLFVEYLDVGEIPAGSSKGRFGPWVVPLGTGTMRGGAQAVSYGGEILVLTDHATFSSAADFATVLSDNGLATVIGEVPGSAPTGAGDVVIFRLPASGLFIQVSYKEFVRPDPDRARSELEVDIAADPSGTVREMIGR